MRKCYIVTYDICDERRLRRVFNVMRGFGDHLQYSVFLCELSSKELAIMIEKLSNEINQNEDQVLIIDLGPAGESTLKRLKSLGRPWTHPERHCLIY